MSVFILIDKDKKDGYTGRDKKAISKESGVSVNTLKSWSKKGNYFENMKYIWCIANEVIGKRGGLRVKKSE